MVLSVTRPVTKTWFHAIKIILLGSKLKVTKVFLEYSFSELGYISATCSSSGFDIRINGDCHQKAFDNVPTTGWYAGNSASESSCKFPTSGNNFQVLALTGDCKEKEHFLI